MKLISEYSSPDVDELILTLLFRYPAEANIFQALQRPGSVAVPEYVKILKPTYVDAGLSQVVFVLLHPIGTRLVTPDLVSAMLKLYVLLQWSTKHNGTDEGSGPPPQSAYIL
ncbi:MAG: hypothetical protein ACTHKV_10135 [Flavipsychrobacter sp.]